jgi:oligopeptide/dipeptide ABC transporter ATP-binding protein
MPRSGAAIRTSSPADSSGASGSRAFLVLEPRVVILDEPTSWLDLSVQATVLRLFRHLRARLGLTYLFVSHDLLVVQRMCDRVAIMYLGRIVEIGATARIFAAPAHPYTRALLAAAPKLTPGALADTPALPGDPPSPVAVPSGCAFRTRCAFAAAACADTRPALEPAGTPGQAVACLRWRELPSVA